MPRPEFVTNEDIARWSLNIDNDPRVPKFMADMPLIREMMYAGLWMAEELDKLGCSHELIVRLQFSTGALCYGKPDPWEVHQEVLEAYKNNDIEFEMDYSEDEPSNS
jgi:hypothetical protein